MRVKKVLLLWILLIFSGLIVIFALVVAIYDPQKPVKIQAKDVTTSVEKTEVQRLLNKAFVVSERKTFVLGAKLPLEVKKEGPKRAADFPFNAIAPSWREQVPEGSKIFIQIRTSKDGKTWSDWKNIEADEDGDAKDDVTTDRIYGRLIVAEGKYFQERLIFRTDSINKIPVIKNLKLTYIDSKEKWNLLERILKRIKLRAKEVFAAADVPKRPTDTPSICSRSCWGADESLRTWDPYYAPLKKMVVHHTVTSNDDPDPPATVRAIYYYHAVTRGWGDIGYNFLVDQNNGTIYEGRYGGDAVIGAHARGYNTGSVGVGVLGDFRFVSVNKKVQNALHKIAVWKFYTHKIDPDVVSYFGDPSKRLPSVFYHGQVANTICAGTNMDNFVPTLRKMALRMPLEVAVKYTNGTISRETFSKSKTISEVIKEKESKSNVLYATSNFINKVSAFPADGFTPPDDPKYSDQWDLPKIDAFNAWKTTQGGSSLVIIAVLDTGVAYEDYDPSGSEIYSKAPDFTNTNFADGYDFANNDNRPNDDHGHGTVVASAIAESTDNELGSASLSFGVSIMPVKVCDKDGYCLLSDLAEGIDFATENGAEVINISLGGPSGSVVLESSINNSYNRRVVLIAASGNDGDPTIKFPAKYKRVLAVGATDSSDNKASFSNYGKGLAMVAPGVSLTYQTLTCTTSLDCTSFGYKKVSGTSISTALVSAAAGTYRSYRSNIGAGSVRHALLRSVEDLGSSGYDTVYGYGRLKMSSIYDYIFSDVLPGSGWYEFVEHLVRVNVLQGFNDGTYKHKNPLTRAQLAKVIVEGFNITKDASGEPFSDVPSSHWAFEYVQTLKNLEVVDGFGDGSFGPGDNVTRGQSMKIVVLGARVKDKLIGYSDPGDVFSDVPSDHIFEEYIERAHQEDIISGYPDSSFRPNNDVTRGQAAKIISKTVAL